MPAQAEIALNPIVRGDTMRSRVVTFTINGDAPTITSGEFHIKGLLETKCPASADSVTLPEVSANVTTNWPVGTHKWDLRVVIDGVKKTYIRGTLPVLASEDWSDGR